jgi:hypothetical protein
VTRVEFKRLTSATGYRWLFGTLVAVVAMAVWVFVTDEQNRWYTLLLAPALLFALYVSLRHGQWIEVSDDGAATMVQRRAFTTERVGLRRAQSVGLAPNGGGQAQFLASGRDGHALTNILSLTLYVERSQPPEVLDALADALRSSKAKGAAEAIAELRAQADHLRAGGSPQTSPLASMCVDVMGGTRAVGAAGSIARLFR